jgi:imidazolonepropionase-like amidohydrolase
MSPKTLLKKSLCLCVAMAVFSVAMQSQVPATVFEGARIIVGDGSVIEYGAIVVDRGVITQIGPREAVQVLSGTRRFDLSGKTLMPALVATHVHPGFQRGTN